MQLFGLEIRRIPTQDKQVLIPAENRAWLRIFGESFPGSWQTNVEVSLSSVVTHPTVFACVSLIASDVGKMRLKLVQQDSNGIWNETESPAFSPLLRKPNHHQTRIKFFERWLISKLLFGNTYALKRRDERRVVDALYILDPQRVRPMIAPDGSVFYELKKEELAGQTDERILVPASEIIHDVGVNLFHDLVGVSPITACGAAAMQGLHIIDNSTKFFENGSQPAGILTAPGAITQAQATDLSDRWAENYSGDNFGKVAVLGNGLTYTPIAMTAHDSQLIEQLKWTSETICSVFHVPPYMVGVGPPPTYNNIEALNKQYYVQCLQSHIESIELLMDEGLGLTSIDGKRMGVEFDLDDLLKMDTAAMIASEKDSVGAGIKAPNEARRRLNLKPVEGGNTPYLQNQNYSLSALGRRDNAAPAPEANNTLTPADGNQPPAPPPSDEDNDAVERFAAALFTKAYGRAA